MLGWTLGLVVFAGLSAPLAADDLKTSQAHSVATFITDSQGYVPGHTLRAGLWIELEDHWHTYWLNPGDSGAPVFFEWKLPQGWSAGEIQFPPPIRIPTPPLETFGYEGDILFYSDLQIPADFSGSAEVELEAEWLVCKDVCIPAVHTFRMRVEKAETFQASLEHPRFEATEKLLPKFSNELKVEYELKGGEAHLSLTPPKNWVPLDLFPAPKSFLSNKISSIHEAEPGRWKIQAPLSKREISDASPDVLVQFLDTQGETHYLWTSLKSEKKGLVLFLVFAFLGGLILNLMPCVFPLISIKFFSVLKNSAGELKDIRISNFLYVTGVLVSFWALALLLFSLRAGGEALGWGFQLQSPQFVIFLVILFSLMAFNFLGWFEIQLPVSGAGKWMSQKGPLGDFLTGVLSTVVASPCTAPFMGVSMGFALSQPLAVMLLIFTSLGLGLSFPYILLALFPKWTQHLPKPGAWMEKVKTFMAFPLLATVIWLCWSLSFQITSTSLAMVWVSVLLLGLTIWCGHNLFQKRPTARRLLQIGFFALSLWVAFGFVRSHNPAGADETAPGQDESGVRWQKYSPEKVETLRAQNLPVFVDFTAAWCITCQVNKQVTFTQSEIQQLIKAANIQMLKADWTNRDPVITRVLEEYDRAGVPLYLFYPEGKKGSALVLPEVLTPAIFKKHIQPHLKERTSS